MADRAAHRAVPLPRSDGQGRSEPQLPGTSMPARAQLPLAYIYQPAPSPTQSGRGREEWVLEFEPSSPPEIEPLMGWISSRDPFAHIRLRFPDRQSAIEFAERQGWPYVVQNPPLRRFRPREYADNFRYDLAHAIARAERPWDGQLSINGGRATEDAAPGAMPASAPRTAASSRAAADHRAMARH
jgi:ETC complex I subunit conserved region